MASNDAHPDMEIAVFLSRAFAAMDAAPGRMLVLTNAAVAQTVNRTKMFHVKHFGTIGAKKPYKATYIWRPVGEWDRAEIW